MALQSFIYTKSGTPFEACNPGTFALEIGDNLKIGLLPRSSSWDSFFIGEITNIEPITGGLNYTIRYDETVLGDGEMFTGCDIESIEPYCCCDQLTDVVEDLEERVVVLEDEDTNYDNLESDITSLQADMLTKADESHTHTINDVTGLQESLDDLDAQTLDVSGAATIADQDTSDPEAVVNFGQGDGRYGITYTRYKTTDATKTSDDVLVMDTDLVVNDLPAGNYILEAVIKHSNNSNITGDTGGIKVRIHGGNVHYLNAVNYQTNIHTPTATANGTAGTIGFSLGVDEQNKFSNTMTFRGVIEVNSLSDVGVQWAQNTSSTSILVLNRGSYLTLTKIN